jgi:hypothetical protein
VLKTCELVIHSSNSESLSNESGERKYSVCVAGFRSRLGSSRTPLEDGKHVLDVSGNAGENALAT